MVPRRDPRGRLRALPEEGQDALPASRAPPTATGQVLTWMRGVSNEPHVMELEFGGAFPADAVDVTATNVIPGWSFCVTRTMEPGLHLRVWVGADDKRLYRQVFER